MGDAVVLDPSAGDAEHAREPWCFDERREAGVERERRLTLERQPLAVSPHRRCAPGDRRAVGKCALRRIDGVERSEALLTHRDRRAFLFRATHSTALRQDPEAFVFYSSHSGNLAWFNTSAATDRLRQPSDESRRRDCIRDGTPPPGAA